MSLSVEVLARPLREADPEVHAAIADELDAPAVDPGDDRQRELRARRRHAGAGLGADQQVRRGLPRAPLLRRLRARRRHRAAGDRPAQGAVRRRVRQRAAALRRAGQRRRDGRAAASPATPSSASTSRTAATSPTACGSTSPASSTTSPPTTCAARTTCVDMAEVERLAREHRPQLIIAGWSAYPRQLDFAEFRRIADEVGAYLMVDMAHFAGLVAAGLHPSPVPHAHVVTSTTHKTLGGPRGGVILATAELAKKFNSVGVPRPAGRPAGARHRGQGGGVQARRRAGVPRSARSAPWPAPASWPSGCWPTTAARRGVDVVSGGTDVHLVLVDLRDSAAGRQAGRGPAAPGRHHRQPQRGAVRPAPADGQLRRPHRHPGAGRPRLRRRRLRRGRRHHRRGPAADARRRRASPSCATRVTAPGRPASPLYPDLTEGAR